MSMEFYLNTVSSIPVSLKMVLINVFRQFIPYPECEKKHCDEYISTMFPSPFVSKIISEWGGEGLFSNIIELMKQWNPFFVPAIVFRNQDDPVYAVQPYSVLVSQGKALPWWNTFHPPYELHRVAVLQWDVAFSRFQTFWKELSKFVTTSIETLYCSFLPEVWRQLAWLSCAPMIPDIH